jgi:hypothetical protein
VCDYVPDDAVTVFAGYGLAFSAAANRFIRLRDIA